MLSPIIVLSAVSPHFLTPLGIFIPPFGLLAHFCCFIKAIIVVSLWILGYFCRQAPAHFNIRSHRRFRPRLDARSALCWSSANDSPLFNGSPLAFFLFPTISFLSSAAGKASFFILINGLSFLSSRSSSGAGSGLLRQISRPHPRLFRRRRPGLVYDLFGSRYGLCPVCFLVAGPRKTHPLQMAMEYPPYRGFTGDCRCCLLQSAWL